MKPARSVTGLLVGPAIALGLLAGASQAAHAATPAKDGSYTPYHHDGGPGWGHDHDGDHHGWGRDHDGDHHGWGWGRGRGWGWGWGRGWDRHHGWGWDRRRDHNWGDRNDPRWAYHR